MLTTIIGYGILTYTVVHITVDIIRDDLHRLFPRWKK